MKTFKLSRSKLELRAAQLISKKIRELLKSQNKVVLGIPGGNSVSGIFRNLLKQKINWKKVHVFMVDERLVSTGSKESNFGLAKKTFLDYLSENYILPKENLHPYIYLDVGIDNGLIAYKTELREISHRLDVVLLSTGEDGHVASLFPNHASIKKGAEFFIGVLDSPKVPKKRISASRKLLQKSQTALLLFFGKSKEKAYSNFLDSKMGVNDCPAKLVNGVEDSWVFRDFD
jgi:6-phosphogluconolactonase